MPRKFVPLYIKLDPKLGKALKQATQAQGATKREIVEKALTELLDRCNTPQTPTVTV